MSDMPSFVEVPEAKKKHAESGRENFRIQSERTLRGHLYVTQGIIAQYHEVTSTVDHTLPKSSRLPPHITRV